MATRLGSSVSTLSQALFLLVQVGETANCPPLKALAGVAGIIIEICNSASANKEECNRLASDISSLALAVANEVEFHRENLEHISRIVNTLLGDIEHVRESLEALAERSRSAWFIRHSQDKLVLQRAQRDAHHCLEVFTLELCVDIEQILTRLSAVDSREYILTKIQQVRQAELASITRVPEAKTSNASSAQRIPVLPSHFYGRHKESELIISMLTSQPGAHIGILGPAGIGKTALAVRTLHDRRVTERFKARIYFVPCDSASSKDDLLTSIAGHLTVQGDRLQKKIIERLGEELALIVLDNFETPWERSKAEVEHLLGALSSIPTLSLVITMRGAERPSSLVKWARPFLPPLKPLEPVDCRKIFLARSNCSQDDPNIELLLAALEGVPLAVTLMASLAQTDSTDVLLLRWEEESSSMLSRAPDRQSNLDLSIKISVESPRMQAVAEAKVLLSLMSLLPDGIENRRLDVIFPTIGTPRKALSTLWQTALAYNDGTRTRVLSPIRAYITRYHKPTAHIVPMMTYYMGLAGLSAELGGVHGQDIVTLLSADIGNLHSIVRLALGDPHPESGNSDFLQGAVRAAVDLTRFLRYTNLGNTETLYAALKIADKIDNRDLVGDVYFHLAWVTSLSSSSEGEEFCETALSIYVDTGNVDGQAECTWLLGHLRKDTDHQKECEALFANGLRLALQAGNRYCQAKCLSNLAEIAFYKGDVEASEKQSQQALQIFRDLENLTNIGLSLYWLGRIETFRSRHELALQYYEESANILEKAGAHVQVGRVLIGRGDVSFARCDFVTARHDYERAIRSLREASVLNSSVAAYAHLSLGDTAATLGDVHQSRQCIDTAFRSFKKSNGVHGILYCNILYGNLAMEEGPKKYAEAESFYLEALKGAHSAGFTEELAIVNGKLGTLEDRRLKTHSAHHRYITAMALYRRMGNTKGLATMMVKMGESMMDDRDSALSLFYAALPLCRRFEALCDVADCMWDIGILVGSREHRVHALELYEKTGTKRKG